MSHERITYEYLWRLAASAHTRAGVRFEVWGPPYDQEREGFARIMALITLYEENEAAFLKIVEDKRAAVLAAREAAAKQKGAGKKAAGAGGGDNGGD